MGLFDWFEPDPPVHCLKCKTGTVHGWQEKHGKHGLFLWRQGVAAPVDQLVDDECKIDDGVRVLKRLPQEENLAIYYGNCEQCNTSFPYSLQLQFTGDTWTGFSESETVRFADEIDKGWLQCSMCLDAQQLEDNHGMVVCPNCQILLMRRWPIIEKKAEQGGAE